MNIDRPAWMEHGKCLELPAGQRLRVFFPTRGADTIPAKRICADCPVRDLCCEYAIQNHEIYGIWGGLSERERRRIRKQRRIDGTLTRKPRNEPSRVAS